MAKAEIVEIGKEKAILAPMCAKCENEPQSILFSKKRNEYYFYSLGQECEAKRQAARRAKAKAAKVEEVVEAPVFEIDPDSIVFRNQIQAVLWEEEITGQLSDGMWENTNPMDHWEAWCNAKVYVAEEGQNVGRNFSVRKKGYRLTALIEYVGGRMIETVQEKLGLTITEKELRKELNDMAKIMKQNYLA